MNPADTSGRHPDLVSAPRTTALVVDVQENFRAHIFAFDAMVAAIELLVRGCEALGVPVVVSEQYPEGLGHTVRELDEVTTTASRFEKLEISACAAPAFGELAADVRDRDTFIVTGIEAHVCVNQTVHDLLAAGKKVHVPADAVGSRDPWQREMALERLARAGATITTVETVLFEMLEKAGTPHFKAVQKLIKQHDALRREATRSEERVADDAGVSGVSAGQGHRLGVRS